MYLILFIHSTIKDSKFKFKVILFLILSFSHIIFFIFILHKIFPHHFLIFYHYVNLIIFHNF